SVAANVGGIDELLAGRPGSWEANYVHSLLFGTIGPDPQDLLRHRTEPIVVPLNVPSLVADLVSAGAAPDGVSAYDDVVDRVSEPDAEAHSEAWDLFSDTLADLLERYRKAYAAYGQTFTDAVLAYAQTLPELRDTYGGLLVPVAVVVEADPESDGEEVENPSEFDDPLVWKLWECAFRRVPLPVVAEPAP
ncbi:MAG: hypothetical protein VB036_01235, partial [Propionicimonas sp.]|nr:hypothetical protein [Propionicimonas sp.]